MRCDLHERHLHDTRVCGNSTAGKVSGKPGYSKIKILCKTTARICQGISATTTPCSGQMIRCVEYSIFTRTPFVLVYNLYFVLN